MKRKICVVTSSRADYGLLTPLLHEIYNDETLELQLLVTGMHLSKEYGYTYTEIEKDFLIDKKIDIELSSHDSVGISKSMGLAQIYFAQTYAQYQPDIVVVLGDRFEIHAAVSSAMIARLPIAHLSGGELTLGAIDDCMRHAITKMSHLHFVATEVYKQRVIQLGENPQHVFNFGEAGLDNIFQMELLSQEAFEESINHKLLKKSLLVTYHPMTLKTLDENILDVQNILECLDELEDTSLIFTKANADEGGEKINALLEDFVGLNKDKAVLFSSLGQLRYLSGLQYVDAVIGNTSSGIVEAPSFKIGSINIGDRQKGRVQALSVLNTTLGKDSITQALTQLYTSEFREVVKQVVNPYYQKSSSFKTKEVLKNIDLDGLINKEFQDIV